jgi:glycosyltransferase involved in cell wall biosynthesis
MFGLRGLRPDREITGFETAFSEIAPRLAARGHRVTIYGRSAAHSPERRVPTDSGVEIRYMPSPGGKNFSAVTATALAVVHALATQSFDVWFFVNVGMGHHSTLARLAGRPVVMNVDGLDWHRGKWGRAARAYFRSAARAAVRRCTTLITDAEAMRAYYREAFGRDSEMIAYGASIETSERPELIAAYRVHPRQYYFIVSRLIPENTLEPLLEGFRRSRSRRTLLVAGGASYRDAFHRRLSDIAAGDERIRLVGHVSDQAALKELWCNCYVYLHGHSVGGTNPSLLRAMGFGAAIAARDTVFNREVLAGSGRLFAPDADAIGTLIDELDADADAVARLRLAGPERIRTNYTWDAVVDSYERVFAEAAATFRGA